MGIGAISSAGSYAGGQTTAASTADIASKSIKNEISEVKREKQALSSKPELSPEEKEQKSRELQQQMGSLNVKLRRQLEETDRKQKQKELTDEIRKDENKQEDGGKAKAEKADAKASERNVKVSGEENGKTRGVESDDKAVQSKDDERRTEDTQQALTVKQDDKDAEKTAGMKPEQTRKIISADADAKRARQQERIVARMEEGIVVLKSEIRQDELRGANTDKKKEELAKRESRMNQELLPKVSAAERQGRADRAREPQKADAGMMAARGVSPILNRSAQTPEVAIFGV